MNIFGTLNAKLKRFGDAKYVRQRLFNLAKGT